MFYLLLQATLGPAIYHWDINTGKCEFPSHCKGKNSMNTHIKRKNKECLKGLAAWSVCSLWVGSWKLFSATWQFNQKQKFLREFEMCRRKETEQRQRVGFSLPVVSHSAFGRINKAEEKHQRRKTVKRERDQNSEESLVWQAFNHKASKTIHTNTQVRMHTHKCAWGGHVTRHRMQSQTTNEVKRN